MKSIKIFICIVLVFFVIACDNLVDNGQIKEGGPCDYVTYEVIVKVTRVEKESVILSDDQEEFYVETYLFQETPRVNESYHLTIDKITQGSCTPVQVNRAIKVDS
ncbi:hypothetical protein [Pleionea sediminis]|uniref:hypothetical protein n=1 Tax=Pleionea sediminis TaxID=2569479 RepID=UPI0011849DAC|nr:hypothetical protein [Pleionea sediminis]